MSGPPIAGAVDLGALKRRPSGPREAQQVRQVLSQLGLVCDCGRPIGQGGQELVVVAIGQTMTPQGPVRGPVVTRRSFCGPSCEMFLRTRADAVHQDTLAVVQRSLPTNTWLKGPGEQHVPA